MNYQRKKLFIFDELFLVILSSYFLSFISVENH
jgi:hypothetical protein